MVDDVMVLPAGVYRFFLCQSWRCTKDISPPGGDKSLFGGLTDLIKANDSSNYANYLLKYKTLSLCYCFHWDLCQKGEEKIQCTFVIHTFVYCILANFKLKAQCKKKGKRHNMFTFEVHLLGFLKLSTRSHGLYQHVILLWAHFNSFFWTVLKCQLHEMFDLILTSVFFPICVHRHENSHMLKGLFTQTRKFSHHLQLWGLQTSPLQLGSRGLITSPT